MTGPLLEVRNLRVSVPTDRGILHAVRGISLSVSAKETLCLVGESGCGKSLTALALMGLLPRHVRREVEVLELNGQDLTAKSARELARLRGSDVAMIFQDPMTSMNPTLSVGLQLTEGVVWREKLSRKQARARAIELLDRVGIAQPQSRLDQFPHEFSGGQRQRLMIAMALMGKPRLLIADEPTTALDVTIQAQILELLAQIRTELGLGLLLITHDLGVVAAIADTVAVMYAGRIVEQGSRDSVFGAPAHPYTRGLLAAIPVPGTTNPGSRLAAIEGRVPELIGHIDGCAFRSRCAYVEAACATSPIPYRHGEAGNGYECVLVHPAENRL